jgi:hypothetical protein
MSIKTKIAAVTAVALAITGSVASTTTPAEAHGFHHGFGGFHHGFGRGVGAGLVGAAIIGGAIAANDGYYEGGYHYCRWVPRFDIYGNYIGRVRSCYY